MWVYVIFFHMYYLGGYGWHWSLTFHKENSISSDYRHKMYDRWWPTTQLVRVPSLKSKPVMQSWVSCWHWFIINGWYNLLCIHIIFVLNQSKAYCLQIKDIKMYDRRWLMTWLVRVHPFKRKLVVQSWASCWYWFIINGWYNKLCIHMIFALNQSKAYYLWIIDIKMYDHQWPTTWLVRVHPLKR